METSRSARNVLGAGREAILVIDSVLMSSTCSTLARRSPGDVTLKTPGSRTKICLCDNSFGARRKTTFATVCPAAARNAALIVETIRSSVALANFSGSIFKSLSSASRSGRLAMCSRSNSRLSEGTIFLH